MVVTINTIIKKIIVTLFLVCFYQGAAAQYTEIKGYRNYNFGETKSEIIRKIGDAKYDTIWDKRGKPPYYNSYIILKDSLEIRHAKIPLKTKLPLRIVLLFDEFKNNIFYEGVIEIKENINDTAISNEIHSVLLKNMVEKYGFDYEYKDNLEKNEAILEKDKEIEFAKQIKSRWKNDDKEVEMIYDLGGMYERIDAFLFREPIFKKGFYSISISYRNKRMKEEHQRSVINEFMKEQRKEDEKLKEKL